MLPNLGDVLVAIASSIVDDLPILTIGLGYEVHKYSSEYSGGGVLNYLHIIDDQNEHYMLEEDWHQTFKLMDDQPVESNEPVGTNDAGEALQSIEETLIQRGKRYGEYSKVSGVSQRLKAVLQKGINESGKSYTELPPYIRESLELICNKLSRIVNGDPLYDDNWRDIAGYSQLVVDELNKD